jgi:hypothetical protein
MASSLNAATSGGGGVIVTSDASGNLNIQSGGTTVAAVTSTGVAVTGTLSASGNLTGAVGAASSWLISNNTSDAADSSRLVVNGGGATGADRGGRAIFHGNEYAGNNGAVEIASGAVAGSTLILQGSNATSHVKQLIESTTVTDVTSTGLAVTGLVDISAATSGQIKFPATQNASANANTLDDYEEGTFTVTDQSGAGLTFSNNTGRYVKVGGLVYFAMDVIFPTTASVTNIALSLPFQSGTSCAFSAAVGYSNSGSIPSAYIGISQSSVSLYSTTGVAVTNVTFSGKELAISGCYPTT